MGTWRYAIMGFTAFHTLHVVEYRHTHILQTSSTTYYSTSTLTLTLTLGAAFFLLYLLYIEASL